MLLGCIGDDFTGSGDLANALSKQGMRTVLYTGVPNAVARSDVEAGVVALKSRSVPPQDAILQSLRALEWLIAQGCMQVFFKYCSTFDSTLDGNIGPVADALADALGTDQVLVCPAFPGAGRTVYQGHLFVKDRLLNESGMENHPLTPMTDPDIRRWLSAQTPHKVGHVGAEAVLAGAERIAAALERERKKGNRHVVVDAMRDADLLEIGIAADGAALVTGGSGVAIGLPANFRRQGLMSGARDAWTGQGGKTIILCGSCSNATRQQIETHRQSSPALEIDAAEVMGGTMTAADVAEWLMAAEGTPLAFSSAEPETVRNAQQIYGSEAVANALENLFAETAHRLTDSGIQSLVVAGGETSGAVVEGLALDVLEIGPEIAPGVPALRAGPDLVLTLKSGNFGGPDFFAEASTVLSKSLP